MADKLEVGMTLHAKYSDGEFYPAEVLDISQSKNRSKKPVKVQYKNFSDAAPEWKAISELKSKRLPKADAPAAKGKDKAAAKAKAKAAPAIDLKVLTKGTKLQAKAADGTWYAAEVVAVSKKKGNEAPVKVNFVGYTSASDEWVGATSIRSKALKEAAEKAAAEKKAAKTKPPASGRFVDPFFRQYDRATDGFEDSTGFMNRLPLRLEATNLVIHGLVDADKMWAPYKDDEAFQPVLVGGKGVITIFMNCFSDTDCGGSYLETWYNSYVTPKGTPQVELEADKLADALGAGFSFLMRVVCGDAPGNPGAAAKAIAGGRGMFGFPKHPVPGEITFNYTDDNTKVEFDMKHGGKKGVSVRAALPGVKKEGSKFPVQEIDALRVSLDVKIPADGIVSSPSLGGTHRGHNGANQLRFAQHLCCTQHMAPWDATDSISFGDDAHYAAGLGSWGFTPVLKAHIPDFKIAAFKPRNWISGRKADAIVREHEKKLKEGTLAGAL